MNGINDRGGGFAEVQSFAFGTEGQTGFRGQGLERLKTADDEFRLYIASYHHGMLVQAGFQEAHRRYLRTDAGGAGIADYDRRVRIAEMLRDSLCRSDQIQVVTFGRRENEDRILRIGDW